MDEVTDKKKIKSRRRSLRILQPAAVDLNTDKNISICDISLQVNPLYYGSVWVDYKSPTVAPKSRRRISCAKISASKESEKSVCDKECASDLMFGKENLSPCPSPIKSVESPKMPNTSSLCSVQNFTSVTNGNPAEDISPPDLVNCSKSYEEIGLPRFGHDSLEKSPFDEQYLTKNVSIMSIEDIDVQSCNNVLLSDDASASDKQDFFDSDSDKSEHQTNLSKFFISDLEIGADEIWSLGNDGSFARSENSEIEESHLLAEENHSPWIRGRYSAENSLNQRLERYFGSPPVLNIDSSEFQSKSEVNAGNLLEEKPANSLDADQIAMVSVKEIRKQIVPSISITDYMNSVAQLDSWDACKSSTAEIKGDLTQNSEQSGNYKDDCLTEMSQYRTSDCSYCENSLDVDYSLDVGCSLDVSSSVHSDSWCFTREYPDKDKSDITVPSDSILSVNSDLWDTSVGMEPSDSWCFIGSDSMSKQQQSQYHHLLFHQSSTPCKPSVDAFQGRSSNSNRRGITADLNTDACSTTSNVEVLSICDSFEHIFTKEISHVLETNLLNRLIQNSSGSEVQNPSKISQLPSVVVCENPSPTEDTVPIASTKGSPNSGDIKCIPDESKHNLNPNLEILMNELHLNSNEALCKRQNNKTLERKLKVSKFPPSIANKKQMKSESLQKKQENISVSTKSEQNVSKNGSIKPSVSKLITFQSQNGKVPSVVCRNGSKKDIKSKPIGTEKTGNSIKSKPPKKVKPTFVNHQKSASHKTVVESRPKPIITSEKIKSARVKSKPASKIKSVCEVPLKQKDLALKEYASMLTEDSNNPVITSNGAESVRDQQSFPPTSVEKAKTQTTFLNKTKQMPLSKEQSENTHDASVFIKGKAEHSVDSKNFSVTARKVEGKSLQHERVESDMTDSVLSVENCLSDVSRNNYNAVPSPEPSTTVFSTVTQRKHRRRTCENATFSLITTRSNTERSKKDLPMSQSPEISSVDGESLQVEPNSKPVPTKKEKFRRRTLVIPPVETALVQNVELEEVSTKDAALDSRTTPLIIASNTENVAVTKYRGRRRSTGSVATKTEKLISVEENKYFVSVEIKSEPAPKVSSRSLKNGIGKQAAPDVSMLRRSSRRSSIELSLSSNKKDKPKPVSNNDTVMELVEENGDNLREIYAKKPYVPIVPTLLETIYASPFKKKVSNTLFSKRKYRRSLTFEANETKLRNRRKKAMRNWPFLYEVPDADSKLKDLLGN